MVEPDLLILQTKKIYIICGMVKQSRTIFYFIRHAQPNYNNHDDMTRELNEKGICDRVLVTKFLSNEKIDVILSSPYKRSIDTVSDFADVYNLKINIVDDFRERKVDNVWIDDFEAFTKRQWEDFDYKLSDGECLHDVQKRNIKALKTALKDYYGKNIVVGSHGTALSAIINYFDKTFDYENFNAIRSLMPWIVKFTFKNETCINIEKIDVFSLST